MIPRAVTPINEPALDEPLVVPDPPPKRPSPSQHGRLTSLDVVRGLTIAVMILVDDIGDAFPHVNHSPWNGVTFADFVMPWFLFMVGSSMTFSLRKFQNARVAGTKFVLRRALKLFALGVLLQGGGWFDRYSYGFNLATIRWCGILNRIAFAFAVAALLELWVPVRPTSAGPHAALFAAHAPKWAAACAFAALHVALTFCTHVPSWESWYGPAQGGPAWGVGSTLPAPSVLLAEPVTIACDVRGAIDTPECSATAYYDRLLFGQNHLSHWRASRSQE